MKKHKSLYVYGHPGLGKTCLARLLFNDEAMLIRHADQTKEYKSYKYYTSIIFDDSSFVNLGGNARMDDTAAIGVIDAEEDSVINVKHQISVTSKGIAIVILSNKSPFETFQGIGATLAVGIEGEIKKNLRRRLLTMISYLSLITAEKRIKDNRPTKEDIESMIEEYVCIDNENKLIDYLKTRVSKKIYHNLNLNSFRKITATARRRGLDEIIKKKVNKYKRSTGVI